MGLQITFFSMWRHPVKLNRASSLEIVQKFLEVFLARKDLSHSKHAGSMSHISGFLFRRREGGGQRTASCDAIVTGPAMFAQVLRSERKLAPYASSICSCCHPSRTELSTVAQYPAQSLHLRTLNYLWIERYYRVNASPSMKKCCFSQISISVTFRLYTC